METVLALLLKYGPIAVKLWEASQPLIAAARPIIAELMAKGLDEETATLKALATVLAPHRMTPAEEARWMGRQSDNVENAGG